MTNENTPGLDDKVVGVLLDRALAIISRQKIHMGLLNSRATVNEQGVVDLPMETFKQLEDGWMPYPEKAMRKGGKTNVLQTGEDCCAFYCQLEKGATMGLHTHSDADEHITVISGKATNIIKNVNLTAGDTCVVPAGEVHEFIYLEDTTLLLVYRPSKKN